MKPKWDKIPLNQVSNPKQWPTIPARDLLPEGYPVYGANGLIGYYNQYNHEHETILLTCRGATCGSINISAPRSYVTGNAMCLDDLDQNRCNLKFLYHALTYRGLKDAITGSAQPQITRQSLEKVSIPLPPLEEQKRIAAILNQADAIRRKREESLQLTDAFLRSVFLDMFGDPVTNPKGWIMGQLMDVVERLDGGKNVAPSEVETPYRVLKVSAVTYGVYRPEESKYLPEDFDVPDSYIVKNGDLLISRANTVELIGATAYVWKTPDNIALPDKIWKFIWKKGVQIEPLFIYHLSQHPEFRRVLASRASGTSGSMKNIAKPKLLGLPLPLPPLDLQHRFAAIVESVEQQKARIREQLTEAEGLFASLQQRAFKGEL